MTIEKLLENTPEFLESLTHEQLFKHLEPYLVITRPELAPKPAEKKQNTKASFTMPRDPKQMTKAQKRIYVEQLMQQFQKQQAEMKATTT